MRTFQPLGAVNRHVVGLNDISTDCLKQGTTIRIARVAGALKAGRDIKAEIAKGGTIILRHTLSERQIDVLMDGGAINWHKRYSTTNCR